MNKKEIIESGILESYVLGVTNQEESSMIQKKCAEFPELIQEIETIELALINYSQITGNLSNETENKIKTQLFSKLNTKTEIKSEAKIISLNITYYKFGIAASILLLFVSVFYNLISYKRIHQTKSELSNLLQNKNELNQTLNSQQKELNKLNEDLAILADPNIKNVPLKGMNSLLNKSAVIHFNKVTDEVYFTAQNLKLDSPEKQYQLWAIIDGKPVNAGVIDTTNGIVFQKMLNTKNAQAFAVTIENKGGSVNPTLETMCLLGNV